MAPNTYRQHSLRTNSNPQDGIPEKSDGLPKRLLPILYPTTFPGKTWAKELLIVLASRVRLGPSLPQLYSDLKQGKTESIGLSHASEN